MAFSPRSGDLKVDGVSWLARMIDKARADARGTIEDYIYPCPVDKDLLKKLNIDADTFQRITLEYEDDEDVLDQVRRLHSE